MCYPRTFAQGGVGQRNIKGNHAGNALPLGASVPLFRAMMAAIEWLPRSDSARSARHLSTVQPHPEPHRKARKLNRYSDLEVRLVGLWDRNKTLIEMILIVLGTDHFVERHFLLALVEPVPLNGVPRHRECTGILNVNLHF